jgi:hypothetical protein
VSRSANPEGGQAGTASAAVEKVLLGYWSSFEQLRFQELPASWDLQGEDLVLFPEEEPAPICGASAITAYFDRMAEFMLLNETRIADFVHLPLAGDLHSVTFQVTWYASLTGFARPMAGFTHHSAILRSRPEGWKIVQYLEAPRSAVLYFRRVRMDIVPEYFVKKAKALKARTSQGDV